MKKKCYKIICIVFFTIILIFANKTYINAASANISASNTNVEVGDNVTINVSVNAIAWNIKVNGSGISDSIIGYDMDNNKVTNKSYKLDTSKPGTYTINLSGDVTEASNGLNTDQSGSVTITVAEKSVNTQTTQTTTPTQSQTQTKQTQSEPEAKFTDTNKTMYSTGEVNVRSSYSTSSKAVGSLKEGDTITVIGTSTNGWSKVKFNGQTAYVKTSLLTDKKPEKKSNNNFLKSLKIDGVSLNPEFSKDVTDYKITVGKDVESLKIDARSRR